LPTATRLPRSRAWRSDDSGSTQHRLCLFQCRVRLSVFECSFNVTARCHHTTIKWIEQRRPIVLALRWIPILWHWNVILIHSKIHRKLIDDHQIRISLGCLSGSRHGCGWCILRHISGGGGARPLPWWHARRASYSSLDGIWHGQGGHAAAAAAIDGGGGGGVDEASAPRSTAAHVLLECSAWPTVPLPCACHHLTQGKGASLRPACGICRGFLGHTSLRALSCPLHRRPALAATVAAAYYHRRRRHPFTLRRRRRPSVPPRHFCCS
jgi:hypothetical protein